MGFTPLGQQMPEQKKAWSKEAIRVFREAFFFEKFMGESENSIIQTVKELKKTEKGDRALIGLVQDMKGSGIVGDNDIDGRRETLESSWIEIATDQLRNGVTSKGRVDDQRSVFSFRKEGRDKLGYWRANIQEELIILTLSGIGYQYNTNGSTRQVGNQDDLRTLAFAEHVSAPTAGRHYNFTADNFAVGDTTTIAATSVPKYGMLVDLAAEARTKGLKPLRVDGVDHYVYLCHPRTYARLKKDADFRDAIINADNRGKKNPIFTGATVTMDGIIIHTNNRVYNTSGLASGSKWGSGGLIDGTRSLLMGCQALGHADLWDSSEWYEGTEDDDAKKVISIAMYFGLRKLKFNSRYDSDTVQDFGVMAINLTL
jgi:N4-gp56 family major capsid protein